MRAGYSILIQISSEAENKRRGFGYINFTKPIFKIVFQVFSSRHEKVEIMCTTSFKLQ